MARFTLEQWQDGSLRVHCANRAWSGDVAIYLMKKEGKARSVALFSGFGEPVGEGELLPPDPSFAIPVGMARNLMDELWRAGVRPTEAGDASDAQKSHLNDMRALLFAKLNVERPR